MLLCVFAVMFLAACQPEKSKTIAEDPLKLAKTGAQARNIVFILADDHRHDFMGFTGKVPWLKTPNLDRLAAEGVHCPNAFVTTSLCSPSRASILTGLFSHVHTVVDNQAPVPENLVFFPQYLQQAGYQTGFFGKWHMGSHDDNPRPGFDHWVSFRGQGVYYNPTLNINGEKVKYADSTYTTDLLTELAVEWLGKRDVEKPFFLYLSHKAVHAEFAPAQRHFKQYENEELPLPPSFNTSLPKPSIPGSEQKGPRTGRDHYGKNRTPDWQRAQRESWHGVDYVYHGQMGFDEFFKRYNETLLGVDESVGSVMAFLEAQGLAENTLVVYMGDNGFSFGEHGLIDKRHFYEESVKVPFLARCPELFKGGTQTDKMIQNIDVAPTFLALAGLEPPAHFQGMNALPILKGENVPWRDKVFYEYFWEYDFPHTPTTFGVRTERYKYIRYHGVWDTNEFYDLQQDPHEINNLIDSPEHQDLIGELAGDIYDWLESTNGMQIPLKRTIKQRSGDHRNQQIL